MYALRVGTGASERGSTLPTAACLNLHPALARAYYVSAAKFLSSASRVTFRMNARLPFADGIAASPLLTPSLAANAFWRVRALRSIRARRDYSPKLSAIWKTRRARSRGDEHSGRDKLLFVGGKARACTAGNVDLRY